MNIEQPCSLSIFFKIWEYVSLDWFLNTSLRQLIIKWKIDEANNEYKMMTNDVRHYLYILYASAT